MAFEAGGSQRIFQLLLRKTAVKVRCWCGNNRHVIQWQNHNNNNIAKTQTAIFWRATSMPTPCRLQLGLVSSRQCVLRFCEPSNLSCFLCLKKIHVRSMKQCGTIGIHWVEPAIVTVLCFHESWMKRFAFARFPLWRFETDLRQTECDHTLLWRWNNEQIQRYIKYDVYLFKVSICFEMTQATSWYQNYMVVNHPALAILFQLTAFRKFPRFERWYQNLKSHWQFGTLTKPHGFIEMYELDV